MDKSMQYMKNKNESDYYQYPPSIPNHVALRDIEILSPFMSFIKSIVDPISLFAMFLIANHVFGVDVNGYYVSYITIAILLTFQMLDGQHLFLPNQNKVSEDLVVFVIRWVYVIVTLTLIQSVSGFISLIDYNYQAMISILSPILMIFSHWILKKIILLRVAKNIDSRNRVLIVGANQSGLLLKEKILSNPHLNLEFCGFFDDREVERLSGVNKEELLGKIIDVTKYALENNINSIYISLPMASQPRVKTLLDSLRDSTVSIFFVPDFFIFDLIQAKFNYVAGVVVN